MRLDQFSERDQNKIVELAIRRRDNIIEFKGNNVTLPRQINALYVCINPNCLATVDKILLTVDVVEGHITDRIQCIECNEAMTRKYVGVSITHVVDRYMKKTMDYSRKEGLEQWFGRSETEL